MTSSDSKEFASYYSAIKYLEGIGSMSSGYQKTNLKAHPMPQMFLERMQDFLNMAGNPEKGFKYIHITGTAGKGSVAATVHQTLVKSGKKAGLFTSPFIVSTIEKIQVGDKYIDPLIFAQITQELKTLVDESIKSGRHGAPSYFELILTIALIYFKRQKCEYVVLEVGLGGRYDATNIIKSPLVTAITNIGLDHMNILGNSREDIAKDKAGIIKHSSKFFTTEEDPSVLNIFKRTCGEVGAKYFPLDVSGLNYYERNQLLADSICAELGIGGTSKEIVKGLGRVPKQTSYGPKLPARFEIMENRPLIIIDGAHNPSKIESTLFNMQSREYNKLSIVVAISADKDWEPMIKRLSPWADRIYVTRFNNYLRQAVNPRLLMSVAQNYCRKNCKVYLYSDPVQAFMEAKKMLTKNDALLVTGSFYLAGEIRAIYCPEERILRERKSFCLIV